MLRMVRPPITNDFLKQITNDFLKEITNDFLKQILISTRQRLGMTIKTSVVDD